MLVPVLSLAFSYMLVPCLCFVFEEYDAGTLHLDVTDMKADVARMQQTIASIQAQLNATSILLGHAATNPHPRPVAFTAHLSKTINNIAPHHQVVFDNVITNIGGAYSKTNGHFTAPIFGIYSFTVTATNTPSHSTSLSLMKNGARMAVTLAHGSSTTTGQFETSTATAVLNLNAGDEVWAQNEGKFSTTESLDGYNYSSFTGYLINEL